MTRASERCETCRFWERGQYGGTGGYHCSGSHSHCRRRAPEAEQGKASPFGGNASWPYTAKDDWCGEYEPIERPRAIGPSWCGEPINEMSEQRLRETREEMRVSIAQRRDSYDANVSVGLLLVSSRIAQIERDRDASYAEDAKRLSPEGVAARAEGIADA